MTLYEIIDEIKHFDFAVDEDTGEITNAAELDALKMQKEEKAENVALYIKNLKADAAAIRAEEKALAERRKTTEKKAENLTRYLEYCLNGEKLKTPRVAVTYRKSESVECDDVYKVPDDLLTYLEPKLDKMAIKRAIKDGRETGCRLVEKVSTIIK